MKLTTFLTIILLGFSPITNTLSSSNNVNGAGLPPQIDNFAIDLIFENEACPLLDDYQIALNLLKSFEAFSPKAYWDVNRWSVGYGTKSHRGGKITQERADEITRKHFNKVLSSLQKKYPHLDEWRLLVLSVMDYNVSSFGTKLKRAINADDDGAIAAAMKLYVKDANGNYLKGLDNRRQKEALFLTMSPDDRLEHGLALQKSI